VGVQEEKRRGAGRNCLDIVEVASSGLK